MLARFLFGRLQPRKAGNGHRIVHRIVRFGSDEGRMRPEDGKMRDERSTRASEIVDAAIDQKIGIVVFLAIDERLRYWRAVFVIRTFSAKAIGTRNRFGDLVAFRLQEVSPRVRRLSHEDQGTNARQRPFISSKPRVVVVQLARI